MNKKIKIYISLVSILIILTSFLYNKNFINDETLYSNFNNDNFPSSKEVKLSDANFFNKDNNIILVIADSHLYKKSFIRIKELVKQYNVKLVVHLGDHTDFGSTDEIVMAKSLMDSLEVSYVSLPGDRDLAAFSGEDVFYKYFKKVNITNFAGINLSFINNAANFTPLDENYLNASLNNLKISKIIFLSQPIFVEKGNILESKYMGSPTAFSFESIESKKIQERYFIQRNKILNLIRDSNDKLIVSGDHHRSATFNDPNNKTIKYHIVGSSAEYLNSEGLQIKQKAFQSQRVTLISISPSNDYELKEVILFEE